MENSSGPFNGQPLGVESLGNGLAGDSLGQRLHADVQRAVGGRLNLIRELSRISSAMERDFVSSEWIVKRVLFLSYELEAKIHPDLEERERLAILNRFFFKEKGFTCASDLGTPEAFLLNRVIVRRKGAPLVMILLYAFLAERLGVPLSFVDLYPSCFLKWNDGIRSRFIDLSRDGATLSSDELIKTMQEVFAVEEGPTLNAANLAESFTFESFVADYLTELKRITPITADLERALFLQNTLVAYQPSNLQLIGERAMIHRKLGNFKSAMADLKRFFAFHERKKAPPELIQLQEELIRLLDR